MVLELWCRYVPYTSTLTGVTYTWGDDVLRFDVSSDQKFLIIMTRVKSRVRWVHWRCLHTRKALPLLVITTSLQPDQWEPYADSPLPSFNVMFIQRTYLPRLPPCFRILGVMTAFTTSTLSSSGACQTRVFNPPPAFYCQREVVCLFTAHTFHCRPQDISTWYHLGPFEPRTTLHSGSGGSSIHSGWIQPLPHLPITEFKLESFGSVR